METDRARILRAGAVVVVVLLAGCASVPSRDFRMVSVGDAVLTATEEEPVIYDVHYVEGRFPQHLSLPAVQEVLEEINGEGTAQRGLLVELEIENTSSDKVWETSELWDIMIELYETGCGGEWRCIRFVFMSGGLRVDGQSTTGVVLGESFAFIFPGRVNNVELPKPPPIPGLGLAEQQRHIVVHELGHIAGLINLSTPMLEARLPPEGEDPCRCHSNQEDSVMYYKVHLPNYLTSLVGVSNRTYQLNEADMRDIRDHQAWLRTHLG